MSEAIFGADLKRPMARLEYKRAADQIAQQG
jgi:hypothetical protein